MFRPCNWPPEMIHPFANHPYIRMNGIGNEIIIVDLRQSALEMTPAAVRAIARGPQTGFDQMMVLQAPRQPGTAAFMTIYNNDGSQSSACGNGTRCVAWWLLRDSPRQSLLLETDSGLLAGTRNGPLDFTIDMGAPRLAAADIPLRDALPDTRRVDLGIATGVAQGLPHPSAVNMGNPHAVFFVADLAGHDLAALGPLLERHPMFPERANISFAQVLAREHIVMKVWERGAGLTRACGSGACAVLVAAVRAGLTGRKCRVSLPGGDLMIEWRASDGHVLMGGAVELEHEGRLDPALFESVPA